MIYIELIGPLEISFTTLFSLAFLQYCPDPLQSTFGLDHLGLSIGKKTMDQGSFFDSRTSVTKNVVLRRNFFKKW